MSKVPKSGLQDKSNFILLIELLIKDKIIIFRIRIVLNLNIVHEFLLHLADIPDGKYFLKLANLIHRMRNQLIN